MKIVPISIALPSPVEDKYSRVPIESVPIPIQEENLRGGRGGGRGGTGGKDC